MYGAVALLGLAAEPAQATLFAELTGAANPFAGLVPHAVASPALGDLDADGDLDLVVGEQSGGFFYFENTGDLEAALFVARTGTANPLDAMVTQASSAPSLGDLDGDGDLDLVSGERYGTFHTYYLPEPGQGLLLGAGLALLSLLGRRQER